MDVNASLNEIRDLLRSTLDTFYRVDGELLERRGGDGIHERCLQSRFAHHLQNRLGELSDFYVDCEFDSSYRMVRDEDGNPILDEFGNTQFQEIYKKYHGNKPEEVRWMFIDIIVHKREKSLSTDFFCIELKKWNSDNERERRRDFRKLREMVSGYHYRYGFYLVIGRTKPDCKWVIFRNGERIGNQDELTFG